MAASKTETGRIPFMVGLIYLFLAVLFLGLTIYAIFFKVEERMQDFRPMVVILMFAGCMVCTVMLFRPDAPRGVRPTWKWKWWKER